MTNVRVDARGKIFTDVIRKNRVPVLVQTLTNVVHGYMFLRPDERLKDNLNEDRERFIAISDAQVFSAGGQLLHHSEFVAVNKAHIVWVRPDEDRLPNEGQPAQ